MAEKSKAPLALPQTTLGGFTVSTLALKDFHYVKIIKTLYGLCPSKV